MDLPELVEEGSTEYFCVQRPYVPIQTDIFPAFAFLRKGWCGRFGTEGSVVDG
jgi:hypothetical protein